MYAFRLETLQEMGFIWKVDRALAKSIMAEFLRLQLIVGDDLNTSLWAMYVDLKATAAELLRNMDIAAQNLQTAFHRKLLFAGFLVPSSFEACAGLGNGCERFARRDLC